MNETITIDEVKSGCRQAQNDIRNINKGQTNFVLLFSDNVKQIADMHSIITEKTNNTNKNISSFKNTLIFLIYLDDELPKKIKPNVVLVFKKKFLKNLNFFYFLKYLIKNLGKDFFKKMSSFNSLSDQLINYIEKNISSEKIKKIFIIYEGQPFQKNIIKYFKKKNKFLNVTGYDHSAPPALPLNLIYDGCSPDRLLITGKEQAIFYRKYLNWPKKRLKIIPSFRFKKEKKNVF